MPPCITRVSWLSLRALHVRTRTSRRSIGRRRDASFRRSHLLTITVSNHPNEHDRSEMIWNKACAPDSPLNKGFKEEREFTLLALWLLSAVEVGRC
jgi:hypothetical protein